MGRGFYGRRSKRRRTGRGRATKLGRQIEVTQRIYAIMANFSCPPGRVHTSLFGGVGYGRESKKELGMAGRGLPNSNRSSHGNFRLSQSGW